MSKKFIITEDEKKHILGLYGLINEEIDPNVGGTVKIINKYAPGFYSVNEEIKKQLDTELAKVTEFVKKYPNSIVSVDFSSQESSIPNTDNEQSGYFKERRLKEGQLSEARKDKINEYIQNYFQGLKNNKIISDAVEIPPVKYTFYNPTKPFISDDPKLTPWCIKGDKQIPAGDTQGYACTGQYYKVNGSTENNWYNQLRKGKGPDGRYNGSGGIYSNYISDFFNEQNSSVTITVQIKKEQTTGSTVTTTTTKKIIKEECVAGITIRVSVPEHFCQNAEFFLFANETLLYNVAGGYTANLNTEKTSRGIPTMRSTNIIAPFLNPAYGELKNGDSTVGYGFGKSISKKRGGMRSDTFIITPSQASQIVSQSSDGLVTLYFIATTDDVHDDIPEFEVTKDGKSLLVDSKGEKYKPNRGSGKLFSIDACGKTVDIKSNKLSKNEKSKVVGLRAKYVQQLANERLDAANKPGFLAKIKSLDFSTEPDQKAIDLSRAEELLAKMTDLVLNILEKDPDYYGTNTKLTDGNYENQYSEFYKLIKPETGIDFQRKSGIGGLPNSFVYSDDIQKNKLYQDVKRRLDEFYQAFDAIYYDKTKKEVIPSGIKNRSTIASNLKKIPTWRELSQPT
jgi:hypothetical protein